jgi:hypothetical protein
MSIFETDKIFHYDQLEKCMSGVYEQTLTTQTQIHLILQRRKTKSVVHTHTEQLRELNFSLLRVFLYVSPHYSLFSMQIHAATYIYIIIQQVAFSKIPASL